jgi:hypothetical protein
MTQARRPRWLPLGLPAAALSAVAAAPAALAASAVGHVSVTILPAPAGVGGGAMSFASSPVPVRVALGPGGDQAGGLVAYSFGGSHATGSVTLSGIPGTPVTLSLSAGNVARGPGGPVPFQVIAASPGTVSVLDRSGALRLALGATLSIGRQQAPGTYRGSYTVIVDY